MSMAGAMLTKSNCILLEAWDYGYAVGQKMTRTKRLINSRSSERNGETGSVEVVKATRGWIDRS